MASASESDVVSSHADPPPVPAPKKKLKRVRRARDRPDDQAAAAAAASATADPAAAIRSAATQGASVWRTLTSSRLYAALVLLRLALVFVTPAALEGVEYADGVDLMAAALLPGVRAGAAGRPDAWPAPHGMAAHGSNRTRSIVGAFLTSGLPYMGVNVACTKLVPGGCDPHRVGYLAVVAPRVWMFLLSLIGDALLVRTFAVYEGENALWALLTYASSWTTLLCMARNVNFALEALCVAGIVAACFGWPPNVARPLFWLSGTALALGVFLRPPFAFFAFTPLIYLSSLWGKAGVKWVRYVRGALEGVAVFAFWATVWVTVDSVFYGTFKLRFGGVEMESFDMFVDYVGKGLPFSYKGSLVYTPVNAMREVLTRKYLSTMAMNTSPGQMFLSLPAMLGPLFVVLVRESYSGLKVAMKELMAELKQAANSKKAKKRKPKKAGMTKEREDELYVYFDTIQTTFLLGLLIEVIQNNDRLGVISLLSLMPPCIVCIAGTVFGPDSSRKFRVLHLAFSAGMVIFYGFLHQSGIPRVLLKAGAGGVDLLPRDANLVTYKGIVGHQSLLGANVKNLSIYDGGDSRLKLMTTLRDLKSRDGYQVDKLLVLAPGTEQMKEEEFEAAGTLAYGHMSIHQLPNNIDDAFKKSTLVAYRFVGDEDEAIIKDDEEAAEEEERLREEKERKKRRGEGDGASGKEDL